MGGDIHQCVSLPQSVFEYLQVSFGVCIAGSLKNISKQNKTKHLQGIGGGGHSCLWEPHLPGMPQPSFRKTAAM